MIGIELDRPCGEIVGSALDAGLVLNVTADTVIRLLPPLIFDREHADILVSAPGAADPRGAHLRSRDKPPDRRTTDATSDVRPRSSRPAAGQRPHRPRCEALPVTGGMMTIRTFLQFSDFDRATRSITSSSARA
jgi:hypothetical protein